MPFESSTPLVIICLVAAAACGWYGLSSGARGGLIAAGLALVIGAGCFITDRTVVTDREYLEALFPRLAAAAVRQDIDTLVAAVAPELRPLREEVARIMEQVKPREVTITRSAVEVAPSGKTATADIIVRVTGNVMEHAAQGTGIAGVLVTLEQRDGTWLITDAEEKDLRPGSP
jgi:hypothetical protein